MDRRADSLWFDVRPLTKRSSVTLRTSSNSRGLNLDSFFAWMFSEEAIDCEVTTDHRTGTAIDIATPDGNRFPILSGRLTWFLR